MAQLPHPELNAFVKDAFESGTPLDAISTHTKYAPSQAPWLSPLDDLVPAELIDDLLPRPAELSRIDGRLLQIPRNLDVRLLHYRRDLIATAPRDVDGAHRHGEPSDADRSNGEPAFYGFLFPGRDSGLFGMFYELLVSAGGKLFDDDLRPAFDSDAGRWAVEQIIELHHHRRVTPRDLRSLALRRDLRVVPRRRCGHGVGLAGQLSPLSRSGDLSRRRSRRAGVVAGGTGGHSRRLRRLSLVRDDAHGAESRRRLALVRHLTSSSRSSARPGRAPFPAAPARWPPCGGGRRPNLPPRIAGACLPRPSRR